MKFDKIVAFGDSFVWGDELINPALVNDPNANSSMVSNKSYREQHCFLGLLGKHYDTPTENFGWPGGSLQSTIWSYLWWIENESLQLDRTLVLVGLTQGHRHSFYNHAHVSYENDPPWNRFVHSTWAHAQSNTLDSDWVGFFKKYTVLTDCEELTRLNYLHAMLFFQGQSRNHASLLQFATMSLPANIKHNYLIWHDQTLATICSSPDLYCLHGHPNESGHTVIAERLIPEIDRVTLQM